MSDWVRDVTVLLSPLNTNSRWCTASQSYLPDSLSRFTSLYVTLYIRHIIWVPFYLSRDKMPDNGLDSGQQPQNLYKPKVYSLTFLHFLLQAIWFIYQSVTLGKHLHCLFLYLRNRNCVGEALGNADDKSSTLRIQHTEQWVE